MIVLVNVFQFVLIVSVITYLTENMFHLIKAEPMAGPLPSNPLVSICVPARNEERNIEACLQSLLNQDYPNFEVIVLDDNSTDGTAGIIQSMTKNHPNLVFISGKPLPGGWIGKPYSLHQAYQKTQGEYLLFTDADPVFQPHALTSAMHLALEKKVDLLTLMPRAEFGSFWERTIQPVIFGFIVALTRFKRIHSDEHPDAMGFGAFLLFKKTTYQQFGGHARVKDEVLEDVVLARQVKRAGGSILIADAKTLFAIRMYHSFEEIWSGWRKNMFIALKRSVLRTLYYICAILGFVVTPYLVILADLWVAMGMGWTVLSLAGLMMVLITGVALCDELAMERRYVFMFPLGDVVMALIMLNSMFQILILQQTEWRGRVYKEG